jgi:hypothetical protein
MSEYPRPLRLPGEPALPNEPYGGARPEPPAVVDGERYEGELDPDTVLGALRGP